MLTRRLGHLLTRHAPERRSRRGERGQVLIIFAVFLTVIFLIGAASVDYGLWLSERQGIERAADFAALAGAQDLPPKDSTGTPVVPPVGPIQSVAGCAGVPACLNAFTWADRNGYGLKKGATVEVNFFCGNAFGVNPPAGVCHNPPSQFFLTPCHEVGCDAINVTVKKPAVALFSQFFGGVSFDIGYSSWGRVNFKLVPQDTALALDITGSMSGSPLTSAKAAANKFTDILLNGANSFSQVALTPYRDCYNPPRVGGSSCVPSAHAVAPPNALTCPAPASSYEICLSTSAAAIHAKINGLAAAGATNVCLGLYEGNAMFGPGLGASTDKNAQRFVVILTDGDNFYQSSSYNLAQNAPPTACRPATSGPITCGISPPASFASCNPATQTNPASCGAVEPHERQLDMMTKALAATVAPRPVPPFPAIHTEIYVIGFNVCGTNNTSQTATASYCANIGNSDADSISDRRLLKCIASSTPGTNDHYLESPTPGELDGVFKAVAYEIAGHGLVAGAGS